MRIIYLDYAADRNITVWTMLMFIDNIIISFNNLPPLILVFHTTTMAARSYSDNFKYISIMGSVVNKEHFTSDWFCFQNACLFLRQEVTGFWSCLEKFRFSAWSVLNSRISTFRELETIVCCCRQLFRDNLLHLVSNKITDYVHLFKIHNV